MRSDVGVEVKQRPGYFIQYCERCCEATGIIGGDTK